MINNKKILGVITARGGSKGLPDKNIKDFCGKPLINWSIDAGRESKYIDKLIVSSDSSKIIDIARDYGCDVPFTRPSSLAKDDTLTIDVLEHAINYFPKKEFEYIVLIEPTSPLRSSEDIDEAISVLAKNRHKADSVVGVSKVEATHPVFNVKINNNGLIDPYVGKEFLTPRRQDIEPLYFYEGSIYVSTIDKLIEGRSFYHSRTLPLVMPKWKSIEIDDLSDFMVAEIFKKKYDLLINDDNQ